MSQTKFQEPFRPVLLNLTVTTIEELDARANGLGWTRSDVMRRLLKVGLQETKSANVSEQVERRYGRAWWVSEPADRLDLDATSVETEDLPRDLLARTDTTSGNDAGILASSLQTTCARGYRISETALAVFYQGLTQP